MIDLHAHTTASDGENNPSELIDMAIEHGLSAIAITDHDSIDGLEEAYNYSKDKNIIFIPGIEMDASVPIGKMHIVGLFIDFKNSAFKEKLNKVIEYRNIRNAYFIKELNNMGYDITLEELQKEASGNVIGKPHFARIFLRKGYIKTKDEMFDKVFNKEPLNHFVRFSYTPKEVISMLKQIGAIVILAHPQSLKLEHDKLVATLRQLKDFGLDGLESYHSNQTPEQMKEYKEIANELGLIYTKGSDYHGPIIKPNIQLGYGINKNIVSDEEDYILERLLKLKQQIKEPISK